MGSIARAYGADGGASRHHQWADVDVGIIAVATVVAVWARSPGVIAVVALAVAVVRRPRGVAVACLVAGVAGGWRSQVTWEGAVPRHLGGYTGWATVVGDPAPFGKGLRVTVEIDGERFDAWVYGSPRRRLVERQAGQRVYLDGRRNATVSQRRRAQIRHVVGRFDASVVGDWHDGSPLDRSATRVRAALRSAGEAAMGTDDAALFTGLVIGDDARERPETISAFRASGLSHLTAVSGENVAFVLAAASPVLRRLRPWWRWATTLALIGWFMAVTRFEPSVLRAGVMAMLASSTYALGGQRSVARLLAWTITLLVLVDPMLVWSVGFWLSSGATAGVCIAAPWLAPRLPGPAWIRAPLSVTLGAQLGVAVPSWLVFHRLPLVSLPANLLAVPVAGFVMLFGIPAGLLAAAAPPLAPLAMAPCTVGTRWVATVARLAASLEPSPGWAAFGWVVVAAALAMALVAHRSRAAPTDVPI